MSLLNCLRYYKVKVGNAEGCYAISDSFQVVLTAFPSGSDVTIVPNPAHSNEAWLVFEKQPSSFATVTIYSLNGNLLSSYKTINKKSKLPVSNFTPGLYLIKVLTKDEAVTLKLAITK